MSKSKIAPAAPAADAVVVAPHVEQPKYAKIMEGAISRATAESSAILQSVSATKIPREGTARAAAYAALLASVGQPMPAVIAAVAQAERSWHVAQGRTPKGVAPAGWLKTFGAKFSA